jgi:valyl-tRNA synthetase
MVKNRAYNEDKNFSEEESNSAKWTLHFLLERFLSLVYPIIPQITTTIAEEKGMDLLSAEWPKTEKVKGELTLISKVMEFNSEVWKKKKEAGVSLREELKGVEIPKDLKVFEKDLKACHRI